MTSKDDYLAAPMLLDPAKPLRASADAMRAYTKATGRTLTDVLQGEDEPERFQALAFFELHARAVKAGHMPDAGTLYDRAGCLEIDFETPQAPYADPLGDGSSRTSPPSAGTGA